MYLQVLLGGFLALGDGGTDLLAENFRAAAGERIQPGGLQFNQGLFDRFFGQPGEVQNFNRRETFQVKPGFRVGERGCCARRFRRLADSAGETSTDATGTVALPISSFSALSAFSMSV